MDTFDNFGDDLWYVLVQRISVLIWVVAMVQFYVLELAPFQALNTLTMHGKLDSLINDPAKFSFLFIQKSNFTWFYLVGFILAVALLLYIFMTSDAYSSIQGLACTTLFALHCWRRYLECLNITIYGDSKIHLVFYLGGLVHYVFVVISLYASILQESKEHIAVTNVPIVVIAFTLYCLSTALQFHSHYILFTLKQGMNKKHDSNLESTDRSNTTKRYPLPRGGGFDYCACPHYLAEIGIYLSLAMLCNFSAGMWFLFVWCTANLSYTATQHYSYYVAHHAEELERRQIAVLFPFLW